VKAVLRKKPSGCHSHPILALNCDDSMAFTDLIKYFGGFNTISFRLSLFHEPHETVTCGMTL
jgi:hypothetical protein